MRKRGAGWRWPLVALLAVALLGLVVSACGDDDDGDTTGGAAATSESASGGDLQAEAQAEVAKYEEFPNTVGVTEPLSKKIPSGVQIAVMNCGTPNCVAWSDVVAEAAEEVGWNAKDIDTGASPSLITEAWNQVVREEPDAVASIGTPSVLFSKPAQELEEKGIPVISTLASEEPSPGVTAIIEGELVTQPSAEISVAWILAEEGTEANVLNVTSPDIPFTQIEAGLIEEELAERCPECPFEELEISTDDIATGANTTKVVGALRSNPDINIVKLNDSLGTGLEEALERANLGDRVSVIGQAPGPVQYALLNKPGGPYKASTSFNIHENAYKTIDTVARALLGDSLDADVKTTIPVFLLTEENAPEADEYVPYVDGYKEEFKELWHIE